MSTGPQWAKTSIFSNFSKVFKNEGKHHIFTSAKLKYKNSHIWIKNVHMCDPKMSTAPRWAKTLIFSIFF